MKKITTILITIFLHTTIFAQEGSLQAELPVIETSKAFKQMQKIVGKWKGKMKQSDGKIIDVETEYKVIANGSAISQILVEDGLEMLTIFNDRNGTLGATHYCVLGNQPTLVLSKSTKTSTTPLIAAMVWGATSCDELRPPDFLADPEATGSGSPGNRRQVTSISSGSSICRR